VINVIFARLRGNLPRTIRIPTYLILAASLGLVAVLGVNLALLSSEAEPQPLALLNHSNGTLVICGGGGVPEQVRDRFFELAGGHSARIVVIPTASDYKLDDPRILSSLDPWKQRGPASVQFFHTRNRDQANDLNFIKPLTEATGVWIGGGKQVKLADAYVGTEVEKQLLEVLSRGGVIGGSSAGAAIMTRVMIAEGKTHAALGQGFDFLQGAVVDQHFMKRNRVTRLLGVLEEHPELVGFGIDERTALVVDVKDSRFHVLGDSYVFACVPDAEGHPARMEILKPGDETDLTRLKADPDRAIVSAINVEAL
jgi:cyanophycinase